MLNRGMALALVFFPLLLAVSRLTESVTGHGFSALGFLPSLLALTLYSMLPILRTATTGLVGVDPAVREAADGVGMTPRQKLWRVELPLALPVIMAGVRTAAEPSLLPGRVAPALLDQWHYEAEASRAFTLAAQALERSEAMSAGMPAAEASALRAVEHARSALQLGEADAGKLLQ